MDLIGEADELRAGYQDSAGQAQKLCKQKGGKKKAHVLIKKVMIELS